FAQAQQNQQFQQGFGLLGLANQGIGQQQSYGLGLGQMGQNFFNQQGQAIAGQLGAVNTGDQFAQQVASGRLSNAQQLLGFGQGLRDANLQQALQQIGGAQSFESNLLSQAQLGASVGNAQANAGANAGALAMQGANGGIGTALTGFASGVLGSPSTMQSLTNLFKPSTTQPTGGFDTGGATLFG
ncbi:MAG: hypothetical protein ACRDL7_12985, partial [Gaiellaceae bacterium]